MLYLKFTLRLMLQTEVKVEPELRGCNGRRPDVEG
jgi:hypothetical protein